jgi:hypothetical protein
VPPTVTSTSRTFGAPKANMNVSAAPPTKSSAERTTFGTSTGLMSVSLRPPVARMARDIGSSARIAE